MNTNTINNLKEYKVCIIGNTSVGKTNLIMKYKNNNFLENLSSTLGIDYYSKIIEIDNEEKMFHIWDTAGQENYKAITVTYLKGVNGIILVYDITNKESFLELN